MEQPAVCQFSVQRTNIQFTGRHKPPECDT